MLSAHVLTKKKTAPPTTMLGALYRYLREADPRHFQPMNANWGLVEPLDEAPAVGRPAGRKKDEKKARLVARAVTDFDQWLRQL